MANSEHGGESELLAALKKQENGESFRDTKQSLNRLETEMGKIKPHMEKLDKRVTTTEHRVSANEDRSIRQDRAVGYLLRREAQITAKEDNMENRLQQNNIRVYKIPADVEGKEMVPFLPTLLSTTLELQEGMDIKLQRAHRATTPKPKATAPPRSIIVRFLDFSVKQVVLQQSWKQRYITFQGRKVFFNQDYSPEVQRKRKQVQELLKNWRR